MGRRLTPLARAAATEDRLVLLRELRTRVIESLDSAECVRDVEPLARRLAAIAAEIDELQPASESSAVDEVLARREDRRRQDQAVVVSHAEARGGAGMTHG